VLQGKTACKIGNVDLDCFYTSSGSAADTADGNFVVYIICRGIVLVRDGQTLFVTAGIWYHMPSAGGLRPSKPFQKHIGMSMESDVNYPQQKRTFIDCT